MCHKALILYNFTRSPYLFGTTYTGPVLGATKISKKKIRRLSDDLDSWETLLDDPDAMVVTMLDPSGRPLGRSISERRQLRHKLKGLITLEMLGDTAKSLGILLGKPMWYADFLVMEANL